MLTAQLYLYQRIISLFNINQGLFLDNELEYVSASCECTHSYWVILINLV